jgi:hypothetical protein
MATVSIQPYEPGNPPPPPRNISGTHFCYHRAIVLPEGLGKLKKLNDQIYNRTSDLPACGTVPQPTTLQRVIHIFTEDVPEFL